MDSSKVASVLEIDRTPSLEEAAQMVGSAPRPFATRSVNGGVYHELRVDNGTRRLLFGVGRIAAFLDGIRPRGARRR